MTKPKYDLSNVGGKPKDWLQRHQDYAAEFSEWDDLKMIGGAILIVALGLGSIAGMGYGLLQMVSYFQ